MVKKAFLTCAVALILFSIHFGAGAQPLDPEDDGVPEGADFVPGELLVRFRPGVGNLRAQQILVERAAADVRAVDALDVQVLRLPAGLSVEQAVETFNKIPEVEFAEPNYIFRIAEITDPGLDNQWAPQKIDAPAAWLTTEGQPSISIAIVDTGVDYRHSELGPNMWSNPGETPGNGLDDDGNGFIDDIYGWDYVNNDGDPLDDHFHGTHVSGIAAAAPNANPEGLVGICPRCSIMALKVLNSGGSGTLDAVAGGITYAADHGAKVISMSLGAGFGSATLESAVNYAWNKGTVLVAAAGNDGADSRLWPAAYENVMAIGSTNDSDFRSCFSSYGEGYVSVAAPGEGIYSTTLLNAAGDDTYGTFSGTSMATPHAAGVAGLLYSQNPARSNADVRDLVEQSSNDLGTVGVDPYFGTGRINAYRAVTSQTVSPPPPFGLFSDDLTASGYAHARKLARDAQAQLHLVWHASQGGQYRILYSMSSDGGVTWSTPEVVFTSSAETFHPAIAIDDTFVHVAFPSKHGTGPSNYRVYLTRKPLSGGSWSSAASAMGGSYHAVRPDLYYDPASEKLHLVASSFDDAPSVFYSFSGDAGGSWSNVKQVNVDSTGGQKTRYADVHADGNNVYIAGRTVEFTFFGLIPQYRLFTIRSGNNGNSWTDLTELAVYDGWFSGEYGASLAGAGGSLYLGYEHSGGIYVRSSEDGAAWSDAINLGGGAWPSMTLAPNGEAWVLWESGGNINLRHFTGTAWDPAESLGAGNYPNLKLGTGGNIVEWAASHCSGAPFRLSYGAKVLAANDPPTANAGGPYSGTEDVGISFDGSSSSDPNGDPLIYSWDFGDGALGTGVSPSHAYTWGGTFTATLTVSDGKGGTSTESTTATVSEVNDVPVADANGPYSGTVGEAIVFDGSGSTDPDNGDGTPANDQILTYIWDFGDSTAGGGVSPGHTYSAAGEFTVTLIASDGLVDSVPATTIAIVAEPNNPPEASFTYMCVDLACTFDGNGSSDSDGAITDYDWDLGDGSIGSGATVNHSYTSAGTYNVVLTVTDDGGATASDTQSVSVTAPPATTVHIGDLDGMSATSGKKGWVATFTITAHNAAEALVVNATVTGTLTDGARGELACMTDAQGECTITSRRLKDTILSVTFTVTDVGHASLSYDSGLNHDGDTPPDSDGTSITIDQP